MTGSVPRSGMYIGWDGDNDDDDNDSIIELNFF